ncbi:DUF91 domain-containing protein [Candidatus Woesearchaeota archaeon]|nr:DUF91 domain-containing protein [Candidatus Woesearchaeota archaeon]
MKIAKPVDYDLSEKELQSFIEKNLESISDWNLQYVASYVPIGTGIIDILAIDDEDNPVIIECKKISEKFDQDAVFQLMRYVSWFIKDPNRIHILHRLINKKYPEKTELGELPLLVAIVGDIEEDVKSACWAIDTDVMLIALNLVRDSNDDLLVSPKVVLDTGVGGEKTIREPKTEKEHFTGRENMKPLYDELVKRLKNEIDQNIKINPTPQDYIGISNRKIFCGIHVKKQWLRLDLLLTPKEVENNPDLIPYGDGPWSYIHLKDINELLGKKWHWIKKAYSNAL